MTKRRIAILISLMLAAPAAVVALEQANPSVTTSEAPAVSQPAAEAPAPSTEASTTTVEVTPAAEPQVERIAAAEPQRAPAPERRAATNPVSRFFGNVQQARKSDAFPEGSMDGDWAFNPLPSQHQYFVRLEEQRANMFARMEQERIARLQPQPVARVEVTPAPVSSDQSAQAGSSEVAIADTSAIR